VLVLRVLEVVLQPQHKRAAQQTAQVTPEQEMQLMQLLTQVAVAVAAVALAQQTMAALAVQA